MDEFGIERESPCGAGNPSKLRGWYEKDTGKGRSLTWVPRRLEMLVMIHLKAITWATEKTLLGVQGPSTLRALSPPKSF